MSTFAFLLLCIQACLMKTAYSNCDTGYAGHFGASGSRGYDAGYIAGMAYNADKGNHGPAMAGFAPNYGAYGATGEGELAVSGDLPVSGTSNIFGQVPVLGAVQFTGNLPASGVVTLSGHCGCDCHNYQ